MARDVGNRKLAHDGRAKCAQCAVLRGLKWTTFQPFKLNANAVIVAVVAATVAGHAGMPGTVIAADKLPEFPVPPDEKMR